MSQEKKSLKNQEQLTLFQGDSHASLFPLPGSNEAERITAIYGLKCYESFPKSNPLGCLVKMFLESLNMRSIKCYLIWKVRATPAKRLLFRLAPTTHLTDVTEFGLWATPNTMDSLPPKSKEALHREATIIRPGRSKPANLRDQVSNIKMWPTPDASQRGTRAKDLILNGSTVVRRNSGQKRGIDLQTAAGGQLNPAWVEWLMGCPEGWTDLKCLETAKSLLLSNGLLKE